MGTFKRSCHDALVNAEDFPRSTIRSHLWPTQGPEHGESPGWTRRIFKNQIVRPESYNRACASIVGPGPSKATLLTRCLAKLPLQMMERIITNTVPFRVTGPAMAILR